ncbi:RINT-1 family protein [Dendrothele bispora CBS 962.96]|uniref:RINT-1 family protein n=1 Tax=Dendrothele bispora (strain CBS 962.96) TaxID=1314807 RepID=A0A4S8LZY7_DENBC|nr:RINT-1 family protein [Dendrothele bispora CBS 962.96]THU94878.1 RINT-1 family protein [Dendrothele bispora CBS 962.96]
MTSQQIIDLLAPPSTKDANQDTVLFLNSKFHSLEDLDGLETLLQDAERRDNELASQFSSSETELKALIKESKGSAQSHFETAQELSLQRHLLADELEELYQKLLPSFDDEQVSSSLLKDIEILHRNLTELEDIKGYVQIIEHGLQLSDVATQEIRSLPPSSTITIASIAKFQNLQAFASKVSSACSSVSDAAGKQTLNVVVFLNKLVERTWSNIKKVVSERLLTAAEQLHWPMPVDYVTARQNERATFERAFISLLELQKLGDQVNAIPAESLTERSGLYPLEVLVQPVALRFKYHFEGTRQTNRPDKPEWYFTHVLNIAHDHRAFMEAIVQRLISSAGFDDINAWREFTRLLLPLLSRKLNQSIPALLPHPSLFAHTIYQALSFDSSLVEEGFELTGTCAKDADEKWPGISDVILGRDDWFGAWLEGERAFTEGQYHEIISSSDAWKITDDDPENQSGNLELKSTNSARRIKDLVEQVTDRYSPLPSFVHRTRFLLFVQLPILENYRDRISSSLDAFETLSSALVRAVPGALSVTLGVKDDTSVNVDTRRLTTGVEGVQRLCKALVSCRFVEAAMEGWGEEMFFVELWNAISDQSDLRAMIQDKLASPVSIAEVTQSTVFKDQVEKYQQMGRRAEDIIVQQVCVEVEAGLKLHLSAISSPEYAPGDDIAVSQTLLAPIALLSTHLSYLKETLPQHIVTVLYRRIASRLSEHILQRQILYRGAVTLEQGKGILAECELWIETCHMGLGGALGGGRNRVEVPWLKLLQAARLIASEGESRDRISDATSGATSQDDWEATITDLVGICELSREEVGRILRRQQL